MENKKIILSFIKVNYFKDLIHFQRLSIKRIQVDGSVTTRAENWNSLIFVTKHDFSRNLDKKNMTKNTWIGLSHFEEIE